MSAVHDAAWYDAAMTGPGEPAMLPLEESPWLPMYERLAAMIDPNDPVVDLGCGTGRFLELLRRRQHVAPMFGVDWSEEALREASRYTHGAAAVQQADLAVWEPDPDRAGNTVYVCSEVLEHLDDDLDLIRRIPPGHPFLLTVPNYWSESHVRWFTHAGDLWRRYGRLLEFRSWQIVGAPTHSIHIAETVKRADAW